jgi:dihydrofolate synthase / folylpolyglutamate synthase
MLASAPDPDLVRAMARLDALTDWERRPRKFMRVGLAPMLDLATRLHDPQKAFRAIHVGGTKGKGSVSALIEAALVRAGLSVGRYASPHVERVNERVSLQGRDVDDVRLACALIHALDAYEESRRARTAAAEATWFDLLTAAAFLVFRDAGVEWAVVEVGLGGRLDSTNVVDGEIAIVTNIGLEHTEILGETRAAIAGEKAGILKPGAVLVTTLDADDEAGRVLRAKADALGSPVVRAPVSDEATIEEMNVAVAGAALDQLGHIGVQALDGRPVDSALIDARTRAAARLAGRMERFDIAVGSSRLPAVFDGAHVPFNLAAVLRDLSRADLAGPCVAVVALAGDKDAAGFLSELKRRASTAVFTELPSTSRGRPAGELSAIAASLGLKSEVEPDPARAFRRGMELAAEATAWLLVTGSLYLVGALRAEAGRFNWAEWKSYRDEGRP